MLKQLGAAPDAGAALASFLRADAAR